MLRRPPSLRNNNGALQVRVRLGGRDHLINRLGRWDDPVAVARAQALSARIWSDAKTGSLDLSLQSYRDSVDSFTDAGMASELPLEEVLRVKAERSRQAVVIHAYRTLLRFGAPLRTAAELQGFADWIRDDELSNRTIAGVLGHCRSCSGNQRHLFEAVLKKRVPKRSVHSDVLSKAEIEVVQMDLESKEPWFYPLFLLLKESQMLKINNQKIEDQIKEILQCTSYASVEEYLSTRVSSDHQAVRRGKKLP